MISETLNISEISAFRETSYTINILEKPAYFHINYLQRIL